MALCKECGVTDDALFYASIKNHCIEHWKEYVRKNRAAKIEYYRAYDKLRSDLPERVMARQEYAKSNAGKESHTKANRAWAKRYPNRKHASSTLSTAVRRGKLKKLPCMICGSSQVEAHHPDYSAPLAVVWLCTKHHNEIHWRTLEEAA